MKSRELQWPDRRAFSIFALFWIGLGIWGLILAWIGFFTLWLIIPGIAAISGTAIYFHLRRKEPVSQETIAVATILLAVAFLLTFTAAPSIFSGRDEGSLSEAAIRLVQNHRLEFSTPAGDAFFKLQQNPGKALNFPGFHYTPDGNLITQFPLGYISWLAVFYALFGLSGLWIANAFLFYLFALSFYFLVRLFLPSIYGYLAILFVSVSFPFVWFSKLTLSENMALALLWSSVFFITYFILCQKKMYYFAYWAAAILLVFTRIEGIALVAMGTLILLCHGDTRRRIMQKKSWLYAPFVILAATLGWNAFANHYFYKTIAKAAWGIFSRGFENSPAITSYLSSFFHLWGVLAIYGILGFLALGFLGVFTALRRRALPAAIPFLITLPTFIYLFSPQISSDHPWMLRRFLFSILPAGIFYSLYVIRLLFARNDFRARAIACALIIFLAAFNGFVTAKYFFFATFQNHQALLDETQKISSRFGNNDLVLLDRMVSDDGWEMMSGPMNFVYNKNATYFFNIDDLEKLDTTAFSSVYLITPEKHRYFYEQSIRAGKIKPVGNYSFSDYRLDPSASRQKFPLSLPQKTVVDVSGVIYKVEK